MNFLKDQTRDGRKLRMLNVVDEFTRKRLCIRVGRKLGSAEVIDVLADVFIARGMPRFIRSDNGPELVATAAKGWISGVGAKTVFVEPGSPWENGSLESFNGQRQRLTDRVAQTTQQTSQLLNQPTDTQVADGQNGINPGRYPAAGPVCDIPLDTYSQRACNARGTQTPLRAVQAGYRHDVGNQKSG